MKSALRGLGDQIVVIGVVVAVTVVVAVLVGYVRWRRAGGGRLEPAAVLATGSLVVVLIATLTTRTVSTLHSPRAQWIPLRTIRHYRELGSPAGTGRVSGDWAQLLLVYVLGNALLFLPLGFFVTLALRGLGRRAVTVSALTTLLVSIAVEVAQAPIPTRSPDVDDVLLNALGGLTGAVLGGIVLAARARRRAGPIRRRAALHTV